LRQFGVITRTPEVASGGLTDPYRASMGMPPMAKPTSFIAEPTPASIPFGMP
jgi:hypothetical protein